MELFQANKQWATRPPDERFPSLRALYDATKAYAQSAGELEVTIANLRTEKVDDDVCLMGRKSVPATLTHWAFGQLCARVGAPASYVRELPATLACQNLNYGLQNLADKKETAKLLFHKNGHLLLRAFTSDKYARIWNWEVAERMLNLEAQGWKPAMPTIRKSAGDFPALYASDHDMFAFVTNNNYRIPEPGNPDGLMRGVIVENSEVGASALKLTRFLYREMCGNHIIWGASDVLEIKVRHIGDARQRWSYYQAAIRKYAESSAIEDAEKVAKTRTVKIGDTKEEVLDKLFGMRSLAMSRKLIEAGYEAVNVDQDGDPRTVWGMVQGLTRHSQTLLYSDERTSIDRAAGKLMEIDF